MPVVIAEDSERERAWLRDLVVRHFSALSPVLEATNGLEAVDYSRKEKASLVFLDIEMPILSGIKAAEQILLHRPETPIVILSHHCDEIWVRQLWKIMPASGAFAYVLKDSTDEQIVLAARTVLEGDCWIHPRIQRVLLQARSSPGTLTDGEFEVLAHICLGLTDRTIAGRLYLTEKAIQARLKSVYSKLGLPLKGSSDEGDPFNHRCRAMNTALRRGLINRTQLEEWETKLSIDKL